MRINRLFLAFFIASLFCCAQPAFSSENESIKYMKVVNAIFDFRIADPGNALSHLSLIHETYKDLAFMKKRPSFVVVFLGQSVRLLTGKREGFGAEDRKYLDEIAGIVKSMSRDGIRMEICLEAAKSFNIEPSTILTEITAVDNGWVSEIGYQAQDYSLIPVF